MGQNYFGQIPRVEYCPCPPRVLTQFSWGSFPESLVKRIQRSRYFTLNQGVLLAPGEGQIGLYCTEVRW